MLASVVADTSPGAAFLAIPLITLQAVVEIAIGGFFALYLTDVTRKVTRGFIVSTGGVLLVVGAIGLWGQSTLPDPQHLTDHPFNRDWLIPSLRLTGVFLALFFVYLLAAYLRPALPRLAVGLLTLLAGAGAILTSALAFPTPGMGPLVTGISFGLSAMVVGTVVTAMLLGHWYLVVPNLSTRPLLALLGIITLGLCAEAALAVYAVRGVAGQAQTVRAHDLVSGSFAVPFWIHVGAGVALPLLITGLALQSTRLRSLMSATGLLYVAVVLTLVGQVTGKVIFFSGGLPL